MAPAPSWKRTLLFFAPRDALAPKTDVILGRLGYQMVLPETFGELLERHPDLVPDLLLVDERRLEEVEAAAAEGCFERAPIVLLSGTRGAPADDPRIVAAIKRPAGLHDLYRLIQQVFEDTPRSTPRVATQLRARCHLHGQEWEGRVLSLSENGCLIRSPQEILLGQRVALELQLPQRPTVAVEAEATYQLLPDTGLVFSAMNPADRQAIGRFVAQTIAA
mgnify:CR=1 FL=1